MSQKLRLRALLLGSSLTILVPACAHAEAGQQAKTIEELVVTARAREERLINVPIAATVVSPEVVARYATNDVTTLGTQLPQVSFQKAGSGSGAALSIRGLAGYAGDSGVEQTVSTALDGVQTSRGRIIYSALFDVQSVQVLKGPQALFFGKNSPAGVLSITSMSPRLNGGVGGFATARYSFEQEEPEFEGAIDVPLGSMFAARLAVHYADANSGFTPNVARTTPDVLDKVGQLTRLSDYVPEERNKAARLTLVFTPNDSFDATLKALSARYETNTPAGRNSAVYACPAGQPYLTTYGVPDTTMPCVRGRIGFPLVSLPGVVAAGYPLSNGGVPYEFLANDLVGLTMHYQAGKLTFTSITGYYTSLDKYYGDFDATTWSQLIGGSRERNTSLTQELRVSSTFDGPLNFTAGAFYQHDNRTFRQDTKLIPLGPDPVTGRWDTDDSQDHAKGTAWSAFGQLQWNIRPDLELAAGARYSKEKKKTDNRVIYLHTFVRAAFYKPDDPPIAGSVSFDNWSPEVTLTWRPRSNMTLYAAYKTGFLSGGFSTPTLIPRTATFDNQQFRPETVRGFEVGAKANLFDGRLSGDLTLYRYDFKDLQLAAYDTTTISFIITNAGKARTQGVEFQSAFQATPELQIRGFAAYNDAYYQEYRGGACFAGQTPAQGCVGGVQDNSGKNLAGSSKWNVSLGGTYDRDLVGETRLGVSADVYYRSNYRLADSLPFVQSGYAVLNASIRLYSPRSRWEFALVGRNLTDESAFLGVGDKPGGHPGEVTGGLIDGREITLQTKYAF